MHVCTNVLHVCAGAVTCSSVCVQVLVKAGGQHWVSVGGCDPDPEFPLNSYACSCSEQNNLFFLFAATLSMRPSGVPDEGEWFLVGLSGA